MKMKKSVALFTINNTVILGSKLDNVVSGVKTQEQLTEDDFANLALATMEDQLHVVHVGSGDSFGERKLNPRERLARRTVKLQLKEAIKQTEIWTIKRVFGELRGKY